MTHTSDPWSLADEWPSKAGRGQHRWPHWHGIRMFVQVPIRLSEHPYREPNRPWRVPTDHPGCVSQPNNLKMWVILVGYRFSGMSIFSSTGINMINNNPKQRYDSAKLTFNRITSIIFGRFPGQINAMFIERVYFDTLRCVWWIWIGKEKHKMAVIKHLKNPVSHFRTAFKLTESREQPHPATDLWL